MDNCIEGTESLGKDASELKSSSTSVCGPSPGGSPHNSNVAPTDGGNLTPGDDASSVETVHELPAAYTTFILQKLAELRATGVVLVGGVWQPGVSGADAKQDPHLVNLGEAA